MPIAPILEVSTTCAARLMAVLVDSHQSSAFCSPQSGCGLESSKVSRPSATAFPSLSQTTAFVAVVEQSIPMT